MSIILLILFLTQIEPSLTVATFQAQQESRDAVVSGILANEPMVVQTAFSEYFNPNESIVLSADESKTLRSVSGRAYYYYSNGTEIFPLHLAAALGEAEICRLLIADGAQEFAHGKGYDWVPAQFAARCGHPELAKILLGIPADDDHFSIGVSLRTQKLVVYRDDIPLLTARISTGRNDKPTPPGRYLVTDKIRLERSTIYKVKMPFFLRLSFSEVGIHYGVNPGHPASHGCIRVGSEELAQKIFETCPIGTLVQIE